MGNRRIAMVNSGLVDSSNGSRDGTRKFGLFEVDLRAGELRRQGHKVKIQDQPFLILAQLLEKPGEVVTRDELRQRLWPADTFVDFDHSLNAAVRRLRDSLGDSAENPTFVETVARRGYRFLAPVTTVPANGHTPLTTQSTAVIPAAPIARRHPWWIAAGIASVLLVLIGLAVGLFLAPHSPAPYRVTRLTANPLDDPVRAAAISKDGRYLAFADDNGFYLRQIDTGETHPIPVPQGMLTSSISWFPDSVHMIAALSGANRQTGLWEMSAMGGNTRRLLDEGSAPAVSPDGKSLAYISGKPLHQRIWVASIDGENPRPCAGEDGDLFGRVAWAPNSKRFAYTSAKITYGYGAQGKVAVVDLAATSNTTVAPTFTAFAKTDLEAPLSWTSDGRLIYTLSEPRPRQLDSNLWSMRLNNYNRPEGPSERLTNDPGTVIAISASGDSKRITYLKGLPEPDVYVTKLTPSGDIEEPQRLTLDDRQDLPYDWTVDNKEVIFISDRTGTFNIYKQGIDQTMPDLLVTGGEQSEIPRLSPDGKDIFYVHYPSWGGEEHEVPLLRVPVAGGTPHEITKAKWISNQQCSRAPANVCLYSVVREKDLTFFSFDADREQPSQVFQIKDDLPQHFNWSLSPDGTTLAIAKAKSNEPDVSIHLLSLTGQPDRWITVHGWTGISSLDWASDSRGFWATSSGEKENALLHVDLQGNVRPVWQPKNLLIGWAIPSRDGKYLALHVHNVSANVWMLDRP